ncbi:MAG: hypothetical protein F6K47_20910 [Symploca sp. SIO2E6]|nr:hypothetical protein [Symploca sp. SIO2E6]
MGMENWELGIGNKEEVRSRESSSVKPTTYYWQDANSTYWQDASSTYWQDASSTYWQDASSTYWQDANSTQLTVVRVNNTGQLAYTRT